MHGSQAVYCTTELCMSVDKLKEEGIKQQQGKNDVSVQRQCLCSVHSVNCEN